MTTAAPEPAGSPPPVVLKIVVEQQTGYDTTRRLPLLRDAVAVAEKVLNDPEYRDAMRAYPEHHGISGFTQDTMYPSGRLASTTAPMDALLQGNGSDGGVHLWVQVEHTLKNEVGHTDQNDAHNGVTHTKDSVLDHMTVAQLADHLVHEHMHRIGFQHEGKRSVERCDSVPYAYGRTVCEFATKKYGLAGECDHPIDWPPEHLAPRDPAHGPRC
jgi:hypothetical protein